MEIHGPHAISRPHPLLRPAPKTDEVSHDDAYVDAIDLSPDAVALLVDSREARLERIRQEIAEGTYDSLERLAATVAILAERLDI